MRKWSRLQPYLDVHGVLSLYFQMEQLYKKSRSPVIRLRLLSCMGVSRQLLPQRTLFLMRS